MRKQVLDKVGCSGWLYPHWKGKFYPKDIPKSKWFEFYAGKFSTVELNSTFYHFPRVRNTKKWYKEAPDKFVYTLKANRYITHMKKFNKCKRLVNDFYKAADALNEKLGCILFQLPPNLHFHSDKLKEIIKTLNTDYKNVLEFRHESWYTKEVYDILKENNIIFCAISHPLLPEDLIKTSKDIYIRFHGKKSLYGSNYSRKELQTWTRKIKKSKAKNVWAYFNNDFGGYAPKNALELRKILK